MHKAKVPATYTVLDTLVSLNGLEKKRERRKEITHLVWWCYKNTEQEWEISPDSVGASEASL